ncbi:histone deacetylase family protein [Glycocaulis profundi]|nr:histone deacetylase family protein [Glycocaulis profundi]
MKTLVLTSDAGFEHRTPDGHPERVERLEAVMRACEGHEIVHAGPAPREALERVHRPDYVEAVFASAPEEGLVSLDSDTWMSPGSLHAALCASGAVTAGVDRVLDGEAEAVFAACRPPGHHAEPDRAMGFCLFNQIAVGALHALESRGLSKVAIIDIDVHHGNGTQAAAEREPRIVFGSIHQGWIYPGTGAAHETGRHGNIMNAPVEAGTAGQAWFAALQPILDRVEAEKPDLLMVSAGFDAHRADPLAGLALEDEDFARAGAALAALAKHAAHSRLVCVLEGGYDCPALESSVRAFLRALDAA